MKIMKKVLALLLALAILSVPMVANAEDSTNIIPCPSMLINSGAEVTVGAGETAYYEIYTASLADLPFTVTGDGAFDVAVSVEHYSDGDTYLMGDTVAANGSCSTVIGTAEYDYSAFAITNNTDAEVNYTCLITFPVGSRQNPIEVTVDTETAAEVTVPAGDTLYFNAKLPVTMVQYILSVEGETGFSTTNMWTGMSNYDVDGVLTFDAMDYGDGYAFNFTNNTTAEQTYTVSLAELPLGSQACPEELWTGETIKELENEEYWYTYTAYEDGTFMFSVDTTATTNAWAYEIIVNDIPYYHTIGSDSETEFVNVNSGTEIKIKIYVPTYNEEYDIYTEEPASGTITFNSAFGTAGDVDCNYELNATDLTMIRKELIKESSNDWYIPGAYDANGDYVFDIRDIVNVKVKISGPYRGDYDLPYNLYADSEDALVVTIKPGKTIHVKADVYNNSTVTINSTASTYSAQYSMWGAAYEPETESRNNTVIFTMEYTKDTFSIYNSGEEAITVSISLKSGEPIDITGTSYEPVVLYDSGDYEATITDVHTEGYIYNYYVPADGTITVKMPENSNWFYVVNNMTTYVYGDSQWSDSDPVVASTTIDVAVGDEIQIIVNTYDPANPYTAPTGNVNWTLSFEAAVAEEVTE